jgi:predicted nucleic acid-binding protein
LPKESERLVINTGPLIALRRAGAFDIVRQLPLRFMAPREVAEEIEAGVRAGHPVEMPPWVAILVLSVPASRN